MKLFIVIGFSVKYKGGRKMIGKMYRPLRISKKNRGYEFSHKYMSNLLGRDKGGIKEFIQTITLHAKENGGVQEEVILIEISNLLIPVVVNPQHYDRVSKKSVAHKNLPFKMVDEKKAGTLGRKMERPGISIELQSKEEHPFHGLKEPEWESPKEKWVLKTDMSSRGEKLTFEMPIYPTRSNEGADWLEVELSPIVWNGEEYMEIKTTSTTKVVIVSNTDIHYRV